MFVDPRLVTAAPPDSGPGEWHLLGGRCSACGTVTFPRQQGCPRCSGQDVLDYELPDRGTLWSWTVQRFEPKPPYRGPQEFVPYGVGYVELAGQCIVEARLTSLGPWSIGDPVSLTSVEAFNDELGAPVRTYAYEPEGAR